jgi:hypothetical protein
LLGDFKFVPKRGLIFYGAVITGFRWCETLFVKGECTNHPPLPAKFCPTGDPGLGGDDSQDNFSTHQYPFQARIQRREQKSNDLPITGMFIQWL